MISVLNNHGKGLRQDYIPGAGMTSISISSRKSPTIRSEIDRIKFDFDDEVNNPVTIDDNLRSKSKRSSKSVMRGNIKVNDAKIATKIDIPQSRAGKLKHEININTPDSYVAGYAYSHSDSNADDQSLNKSAYIRRKYHWRLNNKRKS